MCELQQTFPEFTEVISSRLDTKASASDVRRSTSPICNSALGAKFKIYASCSIAYQTFLHTWIVFDIPGFHTDYQIATVHKEKNAFKMSASNSGLFNRGEKSIRGKLSLSISASVRYGKQIKSDDEVDVLAQLVVAV